MKKPAHKSAKKAAKPAAQSKKPIAAAAKKPAPSKPPAPAVPSVQPYTPGPIQGIGWKPFRYPPE